MSNKFSLITDGLVKNNPTFVLVLGICPTLATTTSAINGMEMGLATMFVLILSNIVISLIAPMVPDKVRIPTYIVVIATFVTLLQLLMQAFVPDVYATLGLFIPLLGPGHVKAGLCLSLSDPLHDPVSPVFHHRKLAHRVSYVLKDNEIIIPI